jgi:hypothetical protein
MLCNEVWMFPDSLSVDFCEQPAETIPLHMGQFVGNCYGATGNYIGENPMPEHTDVELLRYSVSLVTQGRHRFYTLTVHSDVLARTCFVTTRYDDPKMGLGTWKELLH